MSPIQESHIKVPGYVQKKEPSASNSLEIYLRISLFQKTIDTCSQMGLKCQIKVRERAKTQVYKMMSKPYPSLLSRIRSPGFADKQLLEKGYL